MGKMNRRAKRSGQEWIDPQYAALNAALAYHMAAAKQRERGKVNHARAQLLDLKNERRAFFAMLASVGDVEPVCS